MKAASAPLIALLATRSFVMADLYEITLRGGGMVRWTDADCDIVWGGQPFVRGPTIERSQISEGVGAEVDDLMVTLECTPSDLISGVPVLRYIRERGFWGARFKILRAYAPDWLTMRTAGPTGVLNRFSGRMGDVEQIGDTECSFSIVSWIDLLNTQMPRNVYGGLCMHTVYSTGCGLNKASFAVNGTVVAGFTPTQTEFKTNLVAGAGYFDLGMIVFTSGPNSGQRRTVKAHSSGAMIKSVLKFPAAPAIGDTFTIYPGCDRTRGTCISKFNNRARMKAAPFVPAVETPL